MENKNQFTLIDEEGKKVVYDVLFTFDTSLKPLAISLLAVALSCTIMNFLFIYIPP